jgi:GTPase SAR1 family protein
MRNSIGIAFTAGSGKSLLTASFSNWLKIAKQNIITINLDPGVSTLPYTPDIDIRDYIKIEQLMKQYGLGPNGAVIMAADLIAEETERITEEISTFTPDIVLIDTPGQMELFAFRASGLYCIFLTRFFHLIPLTTFPTFSFLLPFTTVYLSLRYMYYPKLTCFRQKKLSGWSAGHPTQIL